VRQALRDAYGSADVGRAKKLLTNLARRLRDEHPGAAASLEDGLIVLAGQVKIDQLACDRGESPEGDCALQASGSWAIQGVDQITGTAVLFTNGSFVADDQQLD
jgi:hypothetical protein